MNNIKTSQMLYRAYVNSFMAMITLLLRGQFVMWSLCRSLCYPNYLNTWEVIENTIAIETVIHLQLQVQTLYGEVCHWSSYTLITVFKLMLINICRVTS